MGGSCGGGCERVGFWKEHLAALFFFSSLIFQALGDLNYLALKLQLKIKS